MRLALAFGDILQSWVGRGIRKTTPVGTIDTAIQTTI